MPDGGKNNEKIIRTDDGILNGSFWIDWMYIN